MNKVGKVLNSAPFGMTGNWPTQQGVELKEGLKSQMLLIFLNVSDLQNPEIYQIFYQTYVWYSFEDIFVERDVFRFKETYGYSSIISNESEIVFMENELPFNFSGNFISGRTFLWSQLVPKEGSALDSGHKLTN